MADSKTPKQKHSMLPRRSFDIIPAGQSRPSSTTRPLVTSGKPQQSDNTLTKKPQTTLMSHHAKIAPVTPPKAPAQPAAPASTAEKPVQPQPASVPAAPTPAFPNLVKQAPAIVARPAPTGPPPTPTSTPVAAPAPVAPAVPSAPAMPAPPVPEVSAPPVPNPHPEPATASVPIPPAGGPPPADDPDELDLAALPGVHGLETDRPAVTAPAAVAGASTTAAPAPATKPAGINQTPQQAMKMAAALRDLKSHPVTPPSDTPVVVVHQHDWLRTLGMFLGFIVIGVVVAAVVFNLLLDAGILQLPFEAYTNFFN